MGESREKKRKRPDDDSNRRKRVAVQAQPQQPQSLVISSIQSGLSCPPVVATSPGLILPDAINFNAYVKPQLNGSNRPKNGRPSAQLLLHSPFHPSMDYTAKEDGSDGREAYLKHYIGVFDPETGRLSVVEARKMAVKGVVRAQHAPEDNFEERNKTLTEMRNVLGQTFGTKKAKKAIAGITANAIAPRKAMADADSKSEKLSTTNLAMMQSMQEVTRGMATAEELQAAVDEARPAPPGHFDAEDVGDVYSPEEIIGADILNAIPVKDWLDAAKQRKSIMLPHNFVATRLNRAAEGPNPAHRLRILRYLLFLLVVLNKLNRGRDRGTKRLPKPEVLSKLLEPAPQPVIESIRRKFSEGGELRKLHLDLLRTHVCVLAAIIDDFEFETSSLRESMGLDETQFSRYFKEIGGRISSHPGKDKGKRVQIAKLALPLQFPQTKTFGRRR